ncbi:hypothetical protein F3Y22_tig00110388pilonHSYRG00014 [Hibiscus syriacus]|uniref:Peroxidase n=1 Tax=Hibiscus syriacus TaxID=106335 RepID=A0A6A3AUW5_HIBSY|nr:hypothetical protein F3Y22_tig00110388pilonHSYRG00014 [Hibiscus syriacus]
MAARTVLMILFLVCMIMPRGRGQLSETFYNTSCPRVESIIRQVVAQKIKQTFVTIPATLRLFFHDCFVEGCDASVMIASPKGDAEKDAPDNLSLVGDGFDTVIKAKAAVGKSFPRVVFRALIYLPLLPGMSSYFRLRSLHLLANRLYSFSPSSPVDPDLNATYAQQLMQPCPRDVDPLIAINMDPVTPRTFDNSYFKNLVNKMGLFASDEVLFTNKASQATVIDFANNPGNFDGAFVAAIRKLWKVSPYIHHRSDHTTNSKWLTVKGFLVLPRETQRATKDVGLGAGFRGGGAVHTANTGAADSGSGKITGR